MSKQINARIAMECAHHEGIIRQAYKDSVGVWTWSVGLTNATGHNVERYIDNPQPLKYCLEIFAWALNNYADAVRAEFDNYVMTDAQFAAALSFHWNTGAIRSATWPDLWKRGNMEGAEASMMQWRKPKEIIPRRTAEAKLMFGGVWSNNGTMTEYTRLTSRHSPVWASARTVKVADIFAELFDQKHDVPAEDKQPLSDSEKLAKIRNILES